MKKQSVALVALSLAFSTSAFATGAGLDARADSALQSDAIALDFVRGITTEIGPRQAGTEAEKRGRDWSAAWLKKMGFANVAIEPFRMQTWVRGEEWAETVSPFAQPLAVAALGNSGSTGDGGLTAPVVYFPSYAALEAAPEGSLRGKIAFVSHAMTPTQDGSAYGYVGIVRRNGPALAARKGAAAILIRSIGTDSGRTPHTGSTNFPEGVLAIPAAALSNPDADNLERMIAAAEGRPVMVNMTLTPRQLGETESGNVVAEITGRDPSLPPLLLACHIDSWDLGTGAIDDGAGCGIIAAAALHATMGAPPLRTIRLLFAGAEETGLWGSKAYAAAHGDEDFAVGLESDFGADRIWRLDSNFSASDPGYYRRLVAGVARFGVTASTVVATGGADINVIRETKSPILDLQQDGTRYFDLHHTANDTFDKIDPAQLRQNVAVWTQVVGTIANESAPIAMGD